MYAINSKVISADPITFHDTSLSSFAVAYEFFITGDYTFTKMFLSTRYYSLSLFADFLLFPLTIISEFFKLDNAH